MIQQIYVYYTEMTHRPDQYANDVHGRGVLPEFELTSMIQ